MSPSHLWGLKAGDCVYIHVIYFCVCLCIRWRGSGGLIIHYFSKLWPSFLKLSPIAVCDTTNAIQSSLSSPQKTHTQKRQSSPEHSSIFLGIIHVHKTRTINQGLHRNITEWIQNESALHAFLFSLSFLSRTADKLQKQHFCSYLKLPCGDI